MLQVASSLDKTGVFCRQLLDCAAVADALMDTAPSTQQHHLNASTPPSPQLQLQPRLHRQPAAAAAAFNYTQHQQTLNSTTPPSDYRQRGLLLPPTFQQLPQLSSLCIGYLRGTSSNLVEALMQQQPGCVKGPLKPPGNNQLVQDVLSVILQAEVAVSLEGLWLEGLIDQDSHWVRTRVQGWGQGLRVEGQGCRAQSQGFRFRVVLQAEVAVSLEVLWLEGLIDQDSHWVRTWDLGIFSVSLVDDCHILPTAAYTHYLGLSCTSTPCLLLPPASLQYPLIQLGQVAPAAAYLKAQRLRAVLLAQTKHYFAANGIDVLLKPSKSQVGIDGLATLLDMPEALLPVSFTFQSNDGDDVVGSPAGNNAAAAAALDALRAEQQQGPNVQQQRGADLQQRLQQQLQQLQQQRGVGPDPGSGSDAFAGSGDSDNDQSSSSNGVGGGQQVWLQPEVNSIVALPGDDAAVIAVGAAFQAVTEYHMVHPILV
jgi:hypothetical protein